jgi:hypothetical protein
MKLTRAQYKVVSDLFHEFNEAFRQLPGEVVSAYWLALYQGQFAD